MAGVYVHRSAQQVSGPNRPATAGCSAWPAVGPASTALSVGLRYGTVSSAMYASVKWMNEYLDPPASADEQAELLTRAGFPLEGREDVEGGDVRQDFEMTSNRGDCGCHIGMAREIAAISGRTLKAPMPSPRPNAGRADQFVTVTNNEPQRCSRYTGRVIRGLQVGPSPKWLADRLTSIGQIPRNNLVDASNFVLFELGQPTHVFDIPKLKGAQIIIRMAKPDESFLPIGEGAVSVKLADQDLVIADEQRAVAIAGVKGGAETAVTDSTTDILIEAASFDPVTVRNTSRRLNIASDSSYRFERGVHPGQVDFAAERLAELILELCGGELCEGVLAEGPPIPEARSVTMRPDRCRALLGVEIRDEQMLEWLDRLEFQPRLNGDIVHCTVPIYRLDIEREIDLIEEVSRMFGHDKIPVTETIEVRIAPPQATELARQAVSNVLVGMEFVETVTSSLLSHRLAEPFIPPGSEALQVDDDRAKAEPVLRPSILPSLLRVRAHNRDNGVAHLRLFECASTFANVGNEHREHVQIALIADMDRTDDGLRPMRGVIERLVDLICGRDAKIQVSPCDSANWLDPGATLKLNGEVLGRLGVIAPSVASLFQLDEPIAAAELTLPQYYDRYPPDAEAGALPSFPVVERDISAIVAEQIRWEDLDVVVRDLKTDVLEAVEFVTIFRGKQIGQDRKSVTMRLRFRAPDRTLTNEDVDVHVAKIVTAIQSQLGAEIRE